MFNNFGMNPSHQAWLPNHPNQGQYEMGLGDVGEFDKQYAIFRQKYKRPQKPHKNLHLWLPTKKLLNEFDDQHKDTQISNQCLRQIVDTIYGNANYFVEHLIKARNATEINQIYEILKQEKLNNPAMNSMDREPPNNTFNKLSNTSIVHICSYLSKQDIIQFKCVSSFIGMQCLKEMQKHQICVFNMNELIQQREYNHLSLFIGQRTDKLMKQNRYSPTTKFDTVLDSWSNRYCIDTKNMLLLYCQPHYSNVVDVYDNVRTLCRSQVINDAVDWSNSLVFNHRTNQYLLFDRATMSIVYNARNAYNEEERHQEKHKRTNWNCAVCTFLNPIIVLSCEMCGNMNKNHDAMLYSNAFKEQKVILLCYFDLYQQNIQFVRFMVFHELQYNTKNVLQYIEMNYDTILNHYFCTCADKEKDKFMEIMERMKAFNVADAPLFKVYDLEKVLRVNLAQSGALRYMIFSLNDKHPVLSNHYLIDLRMHFNVYLNEAFFVDPLYVLMDKYRRLKCNLLSTDLMFNGHKRFTFSSALLEQICAYLLKHDICNCFKDICKATALVAMREMRKLHISLVNMTEFLHKDECKDLLQFKSMTFNTLSDYNRCHPSMLFGSLLQKWCTRYGISVDDIILMASTQQYIGENEGSPKLLAILSNELEALHPHLLANQTVSECTHRTFVILDKTKVFKMDIETLEKDPIEELKEQLDDVREVQIKVIQGLKTTALTLGAGRTLAELFPLLNAYCFEKQNINCFGEVIKQIAERMNIEFMECCGNKQAVTEHMVPLLKRLCDEAYIKQEEIRLVAEKSLTAITTKISGDKEDEHETEPKIEKEDKDDEEENENDEIKEVNENNEIKEKNENDEIKEHENNEIEEEHENEEIKEENENTEIEEEDENDEIKEEDENDEEQNMYSSSDDDVLYLDNKTQGDIIYICMNEDKEKKKAEASDYEYYDDYDDESRSFDSIEDDNAIVRLIEDEMKIDIINEMHSPWFEMEADALIPDIPDVCNVPLITWLYYFDFKTQSIEFCKALITNRKDKMTVYTLIKYIQRYASEWLTTNNEVHDIIQEMTQINNEPKTLFKLYNISWVGKKTNSLSCKALYSYTSLHHWSGANPFQVVVFQLNQEHPYFDKHTHYLGAIENRYHNILGKECHFDTTELLSDESYTICMHYSKYNAVTIRECIHYFQSGDVSLSEHEVDRVSFTPTYTQRVTPYTRALHLYQRIEKGLQFIVPQQCIIIYNKKSKRRLKLQENMMNLGIFALVDEFRNVEIEWSIAPIAASDICKEDEEIEMFHVKIYEPNTRNIFDFGWERYLPYYHTDIFIPYKRCFTANEFVAMMHQICEGLYEMTCEKYLQYFDNEAYSFAVNPCCDNIDTVENCFSGDNIIEFVENNKENKMSLFIVQNKKYYDGEQHSFLVRFTSLADYQNKYSDHFVYERCVGRPERIFIEKTDKIYELFDELNENNSHIYYFSNPTNDPLTLRKSIMPHNKSVYDVLASDGNKNQNMLILLTN